MLGRRKRVESAPPPHPPFIRILSLVDTTLRPLPLPRLPLLSRACSSSSSLPYPAPKYGTTSVDTSFLLRAWWRWWPAGGPRDCR